MQLNEKAGGLEKVLNELTALLSFWAGQFLSFTMPR